MADHEVQDKILFEQTMLELQAGAWIAGVFMTWDSATRVCYVQQTQAMSAELRYQVGTGKLTWKQAAEEAQMTRNLVMETMRRQSTPVGRAAAEKIKRRGLTMEELLTKYSDELFGTSFDNLDLRQQERVYARIVMSSGRPRPEVTAKLKKLSRAGRGLVVLSIAASVYEIATADDKVDAAKKEAAVAAGGIGGGVAGGAVAGVLCGPGAPVCVTAGAFIGGALAAIGIDFLW
jgi:hypothetical protein